MAIIYPMYGCNYSCLGCEYELDNAPGFRRLPNDRFFTLVEELRAFGVEGVEFCGGGEPALHAALTDVSIHANAMGLKLGILTSGTSLSRRFIEEAAPSFSYIRISVDAADDATYRITRPTRMQFAWDRLLETIRGLVSVRDNVNPNLEIGLKFTISKNNWLQIEQMVSLAFELRASNAQFKALRLHSSELDAADAGCAQVEIDRLRKKLHPFPVLGRLEKLNMSQKCVLTPLQVTIDAIGDVYLCCYFSHRKESHCIGNVIAHSFKEVWESPRHKEAIANIEAAQCNNLDCRFVRYHDILPQMESGYTAFI
jgi:radical SAM protein with 4Fe4S-binding SPASM domain